MSDVLFFAEDPGAVNVIAPVLAKMEAKGGMLLLSCGHATTQLRQLGLDPRVVADSADAVSITRQLDPACVVVGTSENPQSPGLALIEDSRSAGRTTIGVVDFASNSAFRFRGESDDALAYAPDWLLVPDQWTADEYEKLGFARDRIRVVGHPQYDATLAARDRLEAAGRAEARLRTVPDAGERAVIVFVSEISTGLNPEQYHRSAEYTLRGRGQLTGRTEIVVEELLDAIHEVTRAPEAQPYLVLRRHPKESSEHLATLAGSFDQVSSGGDPLELIYAADLVVGMTSMLLMEAFLLGVPTLSVVPRPAEREWLPIARTGAVPAVTDRTHLRDELARLLNNPTHQIADSRTEIVPGAVDRIIEFVAQHAQPDSRIPT